MFSPRSLLALSVVAALSFCAFARAEPAEPYALKFWETDDGLPHNGVNSLVQRTDGFLWLATQAGLVRFDGLEFSKWRSPLLADAKAAAIRCVIEEDARTLLIASDKSGLLRLSDGVLTTHPLNSRIRSGQRVSWLYQESDDVFWVTFNDRELWRCRHGEIESFSPPAGLAGYWPVSFARAPGGKIAVARGASVEIYHAGVLQPLAGAPTQAATVCASATEGLWVATGDRLLRLDKEDWTVVAPAPPWSAEWPPNAMIEGRDGALWIGLRLQGLQRWKAGVFSPVQTSHQRINDLLEDEEGNLWVGTAGGGLNRVQRARFSLLGEEAGLTTDVAGGVCEDQNGTIWFANRNGGVLKIREGNVMPANQEGWPKKATAICPDLTGNIWIGTGSKLCRVRADGDEPPTWIEMEEIGTIHAIFTARDGSVWVGGETGPPLRFRGETYESYGSSRGFATSRVLTIGEDAAGHIWIGSERGELCELVNDRFVSYGRADGLPGSAIRAIHGDAQGTLWIGTGGGGLLIRNNGKFAAVTELQGLPDDVISQLIEDDFGFLWFGSSRSLFKIPKTDLLECAAGRRAQITPIAFGKPEGLAGFSAAANYQPAAWKGAHGRLWFVARKGLVTTDPDQRRADSHGPRIYVERFIVDGQTIDPARARFPSSARKLEFHFTTPTYVSPEKVHFRYQLEGFDSDWTDGNTQRFATYSKLSPGRYRFRVTAGSSDLVWNPVGATVPFEVLPMWWETWSARIAALGFGGAGLIALVRYVSHRRLKARLAQLESKRRIEIERTRIARDLHDGLGASLTQVGMMAEELHEDCHEIAEMKTQAAQLADRVRKIARDLDAAVWAVSPRNDSLSSLCSYLCQFALECFRRSPIRCLVHAADDIPHTVISPEARHHLFLIAKEAMNNVLKHSQATQVQLTTRMCGDFLEIEIKDNGRGFSVSDAACGGRNGLLNMRSRMSEVGGQLDVQSTPDGTIVRIQLPLGAETRRRMFARETFS